ncbi:MAG: efflux RND transporter periplasmic adaptor subunit [Roseburia sp.]
MKRKIIAILLTIVLLAGAAAGGFFGYRAYTDKKLVADVYSVSYLNWGYYGDSMESYGTVTNDESQEIYLSTTESVQEIFVEEGDIVSVGDPLLQYDMTVVNLNIEMQKLQIQSIQNKITAANRELETLKKTAPEGEEPSSEEEPSQETSTELPSEGEDTEDPGQEEPAQGDDSQEGDSQEESGSVDTLVEETPAEEPEGYTAEELAKAIAEKEQELVTLDLDKRKAELVLKQLQSQSADGMVYATVNGTVKTLGDLDNPPSDGSAFLVVSGSDGLYVKGSLSELVLDQVQVGQMVSGYTWESGTSFDATITEINDYPEENADAYGGNPNVSYYGYTAYIENTEGLINGEYAELTLQLNDTDSFGGIYLEKAYIRGEDGKSYVYKEDENGRLIKQYVETGRTIYGTAVEIKSGITEEDYIAFPYGKTAKEGVRTNRSESVMW